MWQNARTAYRIHLESCFRKQPDIANKVRPGRVGSEISAPQISAPDTEEFLVLSEAIEVTPKIRPARFNVTYYANDDWLLCCEIKYPLIVFQKRTGLDLDHTLYAKRSGDAAKFGGEHGT